MFSFFRILIRIFRLMNGVGFMASLPASAAESAANAAIEKLNEPGVENNLFSDIRNGGAVCECMLFSISSSLFELWISKWRFGVRNRFSFRSFWCVSTWVILCHRRHLSICHHYHRPNHCFDHQTANCDCHKQVPLVRLWRHRLNDLVAKVLDCPCQLTQTINHCHLMRCYWSSFDLQ